MIKMKKNSPDIQFNNGKAAKKFIREIETVSGLGQRRSAKQIRENELLDRKKQKYKKIENSQISECISEVGECHQPK